MRHLCRQPNSNQRQQQTQQMVRPNDLISAVAKIQALVDGRQMAIEIVWVPGHKDVEGNEKADEAAKEAAKSKGNDTSIPRSTHKSLKSTRSQCIKHEIMEE
jgi:ribonuclease HI